MMSEERTRNVPKIRKITVSLIFYNYFVSYITDSFCCLFVLTTNFCDYYRPIRWSQFPIISPLGKQHATNLSNYIVCVSAESVLCFMQTHGNIHTDRINKLVDVRVINVTIEYSRVLTYILSNLEQFGVLLNATLIDSSCV